MPTSKTEILALTNTVRRERRYGLIGTSSPLAGSSIKMCSNWLRDDQESWHHGSSFFHIAMVDIMNTLIAQGARRENAVEGTRWFGGEILGKSDNTKLARKECNGSIRVGRRYC